MMKRLGYTGQRYGRPGTIAIINYGDFETVEVDLYNVSGVGAGSGSWLESWLGRVIRFRVRVRFGVGSELGLGSRLGLCFRFSQG